MALNISYFKIISSRTKKTVSSLLSKEFRVPYASFDPIEVTPKIASLRDIQLKQHNNNNNKHPIQLNNCSDALYGIIIPDSDLFQSVKGA